MGPLAAVAAARCRRVAADADTQTLAFVLIAAVHHLFVTGRAGPDLRSRVRRIVAVLAAS